jgi:hypothetical protein
VYGLGVPTRYAADVPHLLTLVVFILAAARVTRIVTADVIGEPIRNWMARTFTDKVATLAFCDWCLGFWVSAVAMVLWWWWGTEWWLVVPALAFACSYVVGILASRIDRRDD